MAEFRNDNIRWHAAAVVFLLLLSVFGTTVTGYLVYKDFQDIETAWTRVSENHEQRIGFIGELRSELGYGGFIHDFKNGVLRGDSAKIDEAEQALDRLHDVIAGYRQLDLTPEEAEAINAIESTLTTYGGFVDTVRVMHLADRSPAEVDAIVRVDDASALEAIALLTSVTEAVFSDSETNLIEALVEGQRATLINAWLVPIPVFVSIAALFFVRRLLREISARSKAEQVARDASRVKSDFLATMSHEIRTPMTAVLGFSDILLDQKLDPESRRMATKIKDATKSLLVIINDILDVSKYEAGKLSIDHLNVHVPALADSVFAMFQERQADDNDIEVSMSVSEDFPTGAQVDPTRLRQIFINLIGNAMKFTEKGSVTLSCSLSVLGDGSPALRFEVEDTGIGIQADALPHVFGEFSQADSSISRRFHGTGLGLAICKRLVETQGGRIGVTSTFGKGSTFWFELPYLPAEGTLYRPDEQIVNEGEITTNKSLRILLVEDVELNQEVISSIVGGFGHEVKIADNGREGLRMLDAHEFDVILMDIRMPELTGPEATKMIRQRDDEKAGIPIVALTADVTKEHQDEFLAVGMNAFAAKPILPGELAQAIDKAVGETLHVTEPGKDTSAIMEEILTPLEDLPFSTRRVIDELGLPAESVEKLLLSFADRYGDAADQIREQLKTDRVTASRTAHSLNGLAGTLRIGVIATAARRVELAIAEDDEEETSTALQELARDLDPVVSDIKQSISPASPI